jgi:hypothetical protein
MILSMTLLSIAVCGSSTIRGATEPKLQLVSFRGRKLAMRPDLSTYVDFREVKLSQFHRIKRTTQLTCHLTQPNIRLR